MQNENEIEINGEIYVKKNQLLMYQDPDNTYVEKAMVEFINMGYEILSVAQDTANGPDMHIKKDDLIFRVEIKKARKSKRSMAVHPVEPKRQHDDLIAVVFPSGYVLIEPMQDYLMCCADSGSRSFFGIY